MKILYSGCRVKFRDHLGLPKTGRATAEPRHTGADEWFLVDSDNEKKMIVRMKDVIEWIDKPYQQPPRSKGHDATIALFD